uniref:(northern house mosquito) hypothetical protein n=2 Tax=Culex pipiens TaxID=7175 RepID=A0A8D8E3G3_CULPI
MSIVLKPVVDGRSRHTNSRSIVSLFETIGEISGSLRIVKALLNASIVDKRIIADILTEYLDPCYEQVQHEAYDVDINMLEIESKMIIASIADFLIQNCMKHSSLSSSRRESQTAGSNCARALAKRRARARGGKE